MEREREYVKRLMAQVASLIAERKLSEIDVIIANLTPEKDSLRVFTGVIRSSFVIRHKLKNWPLKVEEFYQYHHQKNTERLSRYFLNLR